MELERRCEECPDGENGRKRVDIWKSREYKGKVDHHDGTVMEKRGREPMRKVVGEGWEWGGVVWCSVVNRESDK